jgi:cytochrome P450
VASASSVLKAPGPGIVSFFTDSPQFRKAPLESFTRYARKFGDVIRYRGLWTTLQISHPDQIQQVLITNAANYRKGRSYRILKLSLGDGLLTSDGALWQRQRKMAQPAFHSSQVASFVRIMERHAREMLDRWEQYARSGEVFDVVPELMRMTLLIVSEALFNTNLESDIAAIQETLEIGRDFTMDRAWSILRLPPSFPTRKNLRHRHSLANFHRVLDRMVEERRASGSHLNDLLSLLMDARDDEGKPMSALQLRDEMATLLTAGHETTTLVLAWALFLAGTRPEVQERMAAETTFLSGRAPGYEDLARLRYTRAVAEETMRLYPPVWAMSRTAIAEDRFGDYFVPADAEVLIFPFVTHRDPRWWQDPESFSPERFFSENTAGRPRGAYLPFGLGPRTCIGLNFAMTEVLIVLAMFAQRFKVELAVDPASVKAEPSVTLRPNPGVPVRLKKI